MYYAIQILECSSVSRKRSCASMVTVPRTSVKVRDERRTQRSEVVTTRGLEHNPATEVGKERGVSIGIFRDVAGSGISIVKAMKHPSITDQLWGLVACLTCLRMGNKRI